MCVFRGQSSILSHLNVNKQTGDLPKALFLLASYKTKFCISFLLLVIVSLSLSAKESVHNLIVAPYYHRRDSLGVSVAIRDFVSCGWAFEILLQGICTLTAWMYCVVQGSQPHYNLNLSYLFQPDVVHVAATPNGFGSTIKKVALDASFPVYFESHFNLTARLLLIQIQCFKAQLYSLSLTPPWVPPLFPAHIRPDTPRGEAVAALLMGPPLESVIKVIKYCIYI